MRKILLLFLFLIVGKLCFSLEVQIPLNLLYGFNFGSGTIVQSYNNRIIGELSQDYNSRLIGGGIGADFFVWDKETFGFYSRLNFYNPYYLKISNTEIKTIFGSGSNFADHDVNTNGSFVFDLYFGVVKKFKVNKFEFPLAGGIIFPKITSYNIYSKELGRNNIVEFGILFIDAGIRYNFTDYLFANIGGKFSFSAGFGGFPSYEYNEQISQTFSSYFVAGYIGMGITIGRKNTWPEQPVNNTIETNEQNNIASPSNNNAQNEFIQIVHVENLTTDRLFSLINAWFASEFKGDSNIQLSDRNSNIISGEYIFHAHQGGNMYLSSSTILVEIREGRYRIRCYNPQQLITHSAWVGGVTGDGTIRNRDYRPVDNRFINRHFQPKWRELASSLEKYINSSINESDW